MRKYILRAVSLLLFFTVLTAPALSQGISGKILDVNGDPIPFAAIYIKELTRGTTCNALGSFSLPLPEGSYNIFFRHLGYTEVMRTIEVGQDYNEMEIVLPPQTYMIPEVRISASGEDPAYWIMRKAIGLAHYHLNEVLSYDAEIYIKGSALLEKLPRAIARRIEVNADQIKVEEGEAYMLESLNEVHFEAPDKYDMRVIASQNTLPGYTENVNPMDYVNASLYQQQIEGIISPLARNAFTYYRFKFDGTFMEGTYIVNKLQVIPKRKSQQLCKGYLYIVEDLWCIHSAELSVETIAGTVHLEQLYANVMMDAWLPVNHKLGVDVDIAGILAEVTYVSSLEYADVKLNPNLPEAYFKPISKIEEEDLPKEESPSKEQQKINDLLQKEELSNRDVQKLSKLMERETERNEPDSLDLDLNQTGTTFSIADSAVINDSLFWNTFRPIPLTPEEHITLKTRDSIMGVQQATSAAAADTTRMKRHRQKRIQGILTGRSYTMNRGKFRFTHDGLLDLDRLGFNTVDGLSYGQSFRINWKTDSVHTLRSHLIAEYAFHRKAPMLTWNTDLLYAPLGRGKVALYLNYTSSDFNGSSGIPDFTNMVYTLFLRENYLKMYEQIDATLYNRIDVRNGLVLTTSATYARQNNLGNNSDFSFFFRDERDFSLNNPGNLAVDDPSLGNFSKLTGIIRLDITPRQPYSVRTYRKSLRDSKWPTFSLEYRHAFPLEDAGWADFSQVSLDIRHSIEPGLLSTLDWSLNTGYFLHSTAIHFSDFRHFKSSPLYIDIADFENALMLMDYYEPSTSDYWVHADVRLTSSYLLIKFLPWFSERLWKESLVVSYLYTPQIPHYVQMGYSLEEIFFLVDLGVYVGFQEGAYKGFGARLNFRF